MAYFDEATSQRFATIWNNEVGTHMQQTTKLQIMIESFLLSRRIPKWKANTLFWFGALTGKGIIVGEDKVRKDIRRGVWPFSQVVPQFCGMALDSKGTLKRSDRFRPLNTKVERAHEKFQLVSRLHFKSLHVFLLSMSLFYSHKNVGSILEGHDLEASSSLGALPRCDKNVPSARGLWSLFHPWNFQLRLVLKSREL